MQYNGGPSTTTATVKQRKSSRKSGRVGDQGAYGCPLDRAVRVEGVRRLGTNSETVASTVAGGHAVVELLAHLTHVRPQLSRPMCHRMRESA
jgi:hypothetical protein